MNRRDFFSKLAKGIGVFTILPGAGRLWKSYRNEMWINGRRYVWDDGVETIVQPDVITFNPYNYQGIWTALHIEDRKDRTEISSIPKPLWK